jgi:ATP-dependent Clp protease ATP-binding subunit ClpB
MTSNIGSHIIQANFEDVTEDNKEEIVDNTRREVMELLKQTIRPELLNRIDEIIMFQPLMKKEIKNIIKIQLEGLREKLLENDVDLQFSEYALDYLAENGFDPQFGARPLKRLIQKEIINQLSKKLLGDTIDRAHPVLVDVFDGTVVFRNETAAVADKKEKQKTT